MALTKEIEDYTTVLPDGQLQVREVMIIIENGIEISRSNHRRIIDVGDDVTNESDIIKDIASGVHTLDRINKRNEKKAKPIK